MFNNNTRYYFKKKGLQVFIYSKKTNQQKARIVSSPDFIQLLNIIANDANNFDLDLWNNLTQREKNFMYKITDLCGIESKQLEINHLKESQNLINRLKLLEGSMEAGNYGDNIINESIQIIKELIDRNQISNVVGSKMISKINNLKSMRT